MFAAPFSIFIGGGGESYATPQQLLLKYANRHGLIAGATGTGKTVTLQILAESFSMPGVPVILSDVKGDLSGLRPAGGPTSSCTAPSSNAPRRSGSTTTPTAPFPVTFWDLFGREGHPVRTTVSEMGPLLLARLLELTEAQEGVLNIAFRWRRRTGAGLLDLKDLQALLVWVGENRADLSACATATSRRPRSARSSGGFWCWRGRGATCSSGNRRWSSTTCSLTDEAGSGRINILAADTLMQSPRLYATFLLWLLSELFETLPEVGDPDKPKLVFFFDEAHLLFDDAPKALVDKVEQVARLIRSKGVGVYFVTQNPADVPEDILGQLGNRVQHALRAFTAKDQQDLRRAAQNYRENPAFDIEDAIREVGTGEAVTSMLEAKGVPGWRSAP
jgi:DNA helicase HerA-like ATPase